MAVDKSVLIAGGGIGGLSAAIALARAGFNSNVLERSTFTEESGAGIQLGPNATRILTELGALNAIAPSAFQPEAIHMFDGLSGEALAHLPLGGTVEARYRAPYLTIHRADLHAGLHALAKDLASVTLTQGFDLARVEAGSDGVTAICADEVIIEGRCLIGADGLWSAVRKVIAPSAALSFTRATAFRTLLSRDALRPPFDAPNVGLWLGPRAHLVHYPVRGGDALNVVAVIEGGCKTQGWNLSADLEALCAGFNRWCKESKSLLELGEHWRAWSLFSLPALSHWSKGAVTLLGDAAHPVLPYLAQGAGLAIEDGWCLARGLAIDGDPASAFSAYETARRARATRLQREARRMGRIYHAQGPIRLARNFVLRHGAPDKLLHKFDWLYGVDMLV
ncbi:MAG: FAD-dependent monooxygenase [Alphaproteobacteria bacterium]